MTKLRRWRAAVGAAAWLCAAEARAQAVPVEVVCEPGCRALRVRADGAAGFRVRVQGTGVEVITPGARPGRERTVRLGTDDGIAWRVAVSEGVPSVELVPPPPRARPEAARPRSAPAPVSAARPPAVLPALGRPPAVLPALGRSPELARLELLRARMTMLGAVGVALGAAGVFAGSLWMESRDSFVAQFNGGCSLVLGAPQGEVCTRLYDDIVRAHVGGVATLVVGGSLLAGGVVALVLRPSAPTAVWLTSGATPLGLGVAGRF